MAQNEIITVLTVKTEKSAETIKGLRKEVADLKKVLDNTTLGTEEFERANEELISAQQRLATALSSTKKSLGAAEGSYDYLVAKMAQLKKEWRATADVAERAALGQQIDAINTELKELDATIGNSQRNVGNYTGGIVDAFTQLKQQIKQYKSELLMLDEDSQEYQDTLAKLGNAQFQLRDINEKANLSISDTGEILANTAKFAQGIVGGFNAIQGVTALLGVENEALEQTFVKLQAGMAIVQGLQGVEGLKDGYAGLKTALKGATSGVKTFIKGLSGVKKALVSTGIGALVVAVGLLIAYWEDISKLWSDTSAIEDSNEAIETLNNTLEFQAKTLQKGNREALKQYTEDLRNAKGDVDKIREATEKYNETLRQNRLETAKKNLSAAWRAEEIAYKSYVKKQNETTLENLNKAKDEIEKYKDEVAAAENDIVKANADAEAERIKNAEEASKKIIEARNKEKDAAKAGYDKIKEQNDSELIDSYTKLSIAYENDVQALNKALKEKVITQEQYDTELLRLTEVLGEKQAEILDAQEKETLEKQRATLEKRAEQLDNAIADLEQKYSNETINAELNVEESGDGWENGNLTPEQAYEYETELNNAKYQALVEHYEQINDLIENELLNEELTAERRKELEQQVFENNVKLREADLKNAQDNAKAEEKLEKRKVSVKKATLQSISSILSTMSDLLGEESKAGKAMAVSSALINTYVNATGAYQSAVNPPAFGPASPAVGAAMAATAILQGMAQVKSILAVNPEGTESIPNSATASATPNISLSDTMPIQLTRNVQDVTDTTEINSSTDTRVYVVESDISDTQARVREKEKNSTF